MQSAINDLVMDLPAVDAHEHLLPETERLQTDVDVLYLFGQYVTSDLRSAGMPLTDMLKIRNHDGSLEERWKLFHPFLRHIRHTSFARPVFIALRDLYGVEDLSERTYHEASERVREGNTPGITDRCIGQKGGIITILNCNYRYEQPTDYSLAIMPIPEIPAKNPMEFLSSAGSAFDIDVLKDLESLDCWLDSLLKDYRRNGVIGLKMTSRACSEVSSGTASRCLDAVYAQNRIIDEGWLNFESASDIGRSWLRENAFSIYPLAAGRIRTPG